MGMTVFDEATAVTPEGDGRYRVSLDGRFAIVSGNGSVGAVNGGVLMACVLRAVLDTSPHPDPVATSAHFLRVPRPEPAQVHVTWLKQGKTAATARAALIQDGAAVLETTVTTGTLGAVLDQRRARRGRRLALLEPGDVHLGRLGARDPQEVSARRHRVGVR